MSDGLDLQALCEAGQRALISTDYLAAEDLLAQAESLAWNAADWDTLSRLYMPLQEARRQRRQRCGEGIVKLDLVDAGDASSILELFPQSQLLIANEGSIEGAVVFRALARERKLFAETFLGASYPINDSIVIAIVPTADVALPPADGRSIDRLIATLPPFSIVLAPDEIIRGERPGTDATYAQTMALWERLHAPFLAHAEAIADPVRRMAAFRKAIAVDYACELAHQHLAKTAHQLAKKN